MQCYVSYSSTERSGICLEQPNVLFLGLYMKNMLFSQNKDRERKKKEPSSYLQFSIRVDVMCLCGQFIPWRSFPQYPPACAPQKLAFLSSPLCPEFPLVPAPSTLISYSFYLFFYCNLPKVCTISVHSFKCF